MQLRSEGCAISALHTLGLAVVAVPVVAGGATQLARTSRAVVDSGCFDSTSTVISRGQSSPYGR